MQVFLLILTLLGSVALFLFGLSLLSGGLQKVAGDGLRSFLASMTSNPFKQIITGIGVTAVIQSSTATTIMVVSFVNAGLLALSQAIGVIMGAHIGTTVTSWIMAVFGFSFNINAYRDKLREEHIDNCEKEDYNYQTGVFYIDIVQELEKMGDFIIKISQSRLEKEVV